MHLRLSLVSECRHLIDLIRNYHEQKDLTAHFSFVFGGRVV